MTIAILMATYNGEKYLTKQISSIIRQTYPDWHLFIRDDGSSDDTSVILESFRNTDKRISVLPANNGHQHGQLKNFKFLMNYVAGKFEYYMFSDQDDIWYPNKISKSYGQIKACQTGDTALLVYTNYDVNNENNSNQRQLAYPQPLRPENEKNILVQNWLMGCTLIFNDALCQKAKDIPSAALNHDNWIAKVAFITGKVIYLHDVTMWHRIHENNVTQKSRSHKYLSMIAHCLHVALTAKGQMKNMKITLATLRDNFASISNDNLRFLDSLIKIYSYNGLKRLYSFFTSGFRAFSKNQSFLYAIILLLG